MVYTFFTRALFVLIGMIVVGFLSYYLLDEMFAKKQPSFVTKESFSEISLVEGVVKNIHTTPTTTMPARIEIETEGGLIKNVVIQPKANCAATNIFDVTQLTAGDRVEVKGITSKRGDVLPCDDAAHYFKVTKKTEPQPVEDVSSQPVSTPSEISNAVVFSGTLDSFDTACFHDGECYAVIDGRKVTVLVGRGAQPVGRVLGADLGVMQEYIGKRFEVYALSLGDDSFTLYGNTAFYIRPL